MNTVTVACKIPNGLRLRLFRMVPTPEPVMGGGTREVLLAQPTGESVLIKGYAAEAGKNPASGATVSDEGFALTYGISKDFFEEWLSQNQDLDAVRNGLIFAHGDQKSLKANARDNEKNWDGLHPLATELMGKDVTDPRNPRSKFKIEAATNKPPSD